MTFGKPSWVDYDVRKIQKGKVNFKDPNRTGNSVLICKVLGLPSTVNPVLETVEVRTNAKRERSDTSYVSNSATCSSTPSVPIFYKKRFLIWNQKNHEEVTRTIWNLRDINLVRTFLTKLSSPRVLKNLNRVVTRNTKDIVNFKILNSSGDTPINSVSRTKTAFWVWAIRVKVNISASVLRFLGKPKAASKTKVAVLKGNKPGRRKVLIVPLIKV